jgi:hypothetical protein
LFVGVLAATSYAENTVLPPPPNCATVTVGHTEYLKGEVYLAEHADTMALKAFGFRRLEFRGRSLGSVKYSAIWPENVSIDSIATVVSGLDYELAVDKTEPTPVLLKPTPELREALEREAAKNDSLDYKLPYRRVIVGDLEKGDVVEYYYQYKATPTKRMDADEMQEINDDLRGNFQVTPIEKGPFHTKENVYVKDDPNLGTFRVLPVEEGPYHKPESVVVEDDPNLGTFHVNPVEEGRYHKTENVTTKNNPAVGTFHIMPDPGASSLRPSDFGILRNYSTFQTGQTFFTTPNNGRPRTMSMEEWRRTYGRH